MREDNDKDDSIGEYNNREAISITIYLYVQLWPRMDVNFFKYWFYILYFSYIFKERKLYQSLLGFIYEYIMLHLLRHSFLFPVYGWQNVALSSMGAVCSASSEYSSSMSCEMALDGKTNSMSEWATYQGGVGTTFSVINSAPLDKFSFSCHTIVI